MFFDGTYRPLGAIDVTPLVGRIAALGDEVWFADQRRQQNPHAYYERHKDTQSILLIFDHDLETLHDPPTKQPLYPMFADVIAPIHEAVRQHYPGNGYFIRTLLPKLPSGAVIRGHVDRGLPLITNPGVTFTIDGDRRHLPTGELVEINNQRIHAAHNGGDQDRVHMLMDWVETDEAGKPRRKPTLDVVADPDQIDEICELARGWFDAMAIERGEAKQLAQILDTIRTRWRKIHGEHADRVSGRTQYLATLEPITSAWVMNAVESSGDTESQAFIGFGRLFASYHVLAKGLFTA
jgi:hypothetical protein